MAGEDDARVAVIRPLTEAAFAAWRVTEGERPVFHAGHYWKTDRGFSGPIHLAARLAVHEASAPSRPHWGFRTALRDDAALAANGTLPVHLLRGVQDYDVSALSKNRRRHLRRCQRRVRFVTLDDPALLLAQGHGVVRSALRRTRHQRIPPRERYEGRLPAYTTAEHRLIIAGLVDDRLGGYLSGYAVDGTAYFEDLYVATEALSTDITFGLVHEFVEACRRSGAVHEVVNGLHARENPALDTFKESIGFPVVHLPARVSINRVSRKVLQLRYPHKLYRLEGCTP